MRAAGDSASADQSRPLGRIITFYSYKGGTGRSMALANVAWVLALNGHRVLIIDWDLEAPGIHRYFHPFLTDKDLVATDGLLDMVSALAAQAATASDPSSVREAVDIINYVEPVEWPRNPTTPTWRRFGPRAGIDLMGAGRQGPSYSVKLNTFNWVDFYERLGGRQLLETARAQMQSIYDYVLIDSRTGMSDTSGICTVEMPDTLVLCFTLNDQSIRGAYGVASSVRALTGGVARSETSARATAARRIFPVPTRVEVTSEADKLKAALDLAKRTFAPFLDHLSPEDAARYWGAVQVAYVPYYAFEEIPAVFADEPNQLYSMTTSVRQLARALAGPEIDRLPMLADSLEGSERARREVVSWFLRPVPAFDPVDETQESYDTLDESARHVMRRTLLRLIGIGPDGTAIARSVTVSELGPDAWMAEMLAERRVLAIGTDEARTVTFKDPVVVEKWGQLRAWVAEDLPFLVWRATLSSAVRTWRLNDRDDIALLRGRLLAEAVTWLQRRQDDLDADERAFIEIGVAAERRLADEQARTRSDAHERIVELEQLLNQQTPSPSNSRGDTAMLEILRYVWGEYRSWAATSRRLKARVSTLGIIVLGLTLLGTALGTLSPLISPYLTARLDIQPGSWLSNAVPWLAATALGIATFLANQLLSESERQAWVKARAVAEGLKSEAHKYVMGAEPYNRAGAVNLLAEKASEAQRLVPGVLMMSLSDQEKAVGIPDGPWAIADYIERRIKNQIEFYRVGIQEHAGRISLAKWVALVLGGSAVLLGVGGSGQNGLPWVTPLLGVVTTAGALFAAWFQSGHHQALALNYQSSASRLDLIVAQYRAGSLSDVDLVTQAELVMQSEHAAWLAEWQKSGEAGGPAQRAHDSRSSEPSTP